MHVLRVAVGVAITLISLTVSLSAQTDNRLVVVVASKGQFRGETDVQGMKALADVAHQRGFPVTWLLKPDTTREMTDTLKQWNKAHGDEVGWLAEFSDPSATEEFDAMKKTVTWHPIRSAGHTRYDRNWANLAQKFGITGVWGRCFEQTFADNIVDRGSPFGFYYLDHACYKVPATNDGGLVSVPWVSSDPNLTFRTGWASGFTFDPNDPLSIGVIRAGNITYWKALVDAHIEQTRHNEFVPLVIQQEYPSVGDSLRNNDPEVLQVLEELLDYVKSRNVRAMTMSDAVALYRKVNAKRTPPTYALFDNLGSVGLAATPTPHSKTKRLHQLEVTSNRFAKATAGKPFNGFYATDFRDNTRFYFHPEGKRYNEHGALLSYYDANGLLMFDEGQSKPVRITSYLSLPMGAHTPMVLPEMSMWYDTADSIPEPVIETKEGPGGLSVNVQVEWTPTGRFTFSRLPYGVMVWGDYSRYRAPPDAPAGTKVLATEGIFIPIVLRTGPNRLQLNFTRIR
jgi:hypothetical protein